MKKQIVRYYPKSGNGRSPYPLPVMLRVHCMQLFCNLFAGLRLTAPIPDETTLLNFRHLLEKRQPGKGILKEVNHYLERNGLLLREGTIVDATIISAPTSTENKAGKREPQMHQTRKGNQ